MAGYLRNGVVRGPVHSNGIEHGSDRDGAGRRRIWVDGRPIGSRCIRLWWCQAWQEAGRLLFFFPVSSRSRSAFRRNRAREMRGDGFRSGGGLEQPGVRATATWGRVRGGSWASNLIPGWVWSARRSWVSHSFGGAVGPWNMPVQHPQRLSAFWCFNRRWKRGFSIVRSVSTIARRALER